MEPGWAVVSHLKPHYKKLLAIVTCTATAYCIKKVMDKLQEKRNKSAGKDKKKIKEFPSVEQIQQFIEELPLDTVACDPNITLKSLLGELSEFSEDEEWKELIASVHSICEEDKNDLTDDMFSEDVLSIHEDENVMTFRSIPDHPEDTPNKSDEILSDDDYGSASSKTNNIQDNKGEGDVEIMLEKPNKREGGEEANNIVKGNPAGDTKTFVKLGNQDNKLT